MTPLLCVGRCPSQERYLWKQRGKKLAQIEKCIATCSLSQLHQALPHLLFGEGVVGNGQHDGVNDAHEILLRNGTSKVSIQLEDEAARRIAQTAILPLKQQRQPKVPQGNSKVQQQKESVAQGNPEVQQQKQMVAQGNPKVEQRKLLGLSMWTERNITMPFIDGKPLRCGMVKWNGTTIGIDVDSRSPSLRVENMTMIILEERSEVCTVRFDCDDVATTLSSAGICNDVISIVQSYAGSQYFLRPMTEYYEMHSTPWWTFTNEMVSAAYDNRASLVPLIASKITSLKKRGFEPVTEGNWIRYARFQMRCLAYVKVTKPSLEHYLFVAQYGENRVEAYEAFINPLQTTYEVQGYGIPVNLKTIVSDYEHCDWLVKEYNNLK